LTPAAATFTSTSPAPGCGTGRRSGTSISGPPGARMAITVISAGNAGIGTDPWWRESGLSNGRRRV
jgi:hypothetical protein